MARMKIILAKWMRKLNHGFYLTICWIITSLILSACNAEPERDQGVVYLPPTLAVSPSSTPDLPNPTPARSLPTVTPACVNNLRFLDDLTIPDGMQVSPGALLDKRWKVENTGTCNWDNRYRLTRIAGDGLGAGSEQMLFPARSGTEAEIAIQFHAPDEPGVYHSAWQAVDPDGRPFGDPIYIEFFVSD
jgi:hypothetical protein